MKASRFANPLPAGLDLLSAPDSIYRCVLVLLMIRRLPPGCSFREPIENNTTRPGLVMASLEGLGSSDPVS